MSIAEELRIMTQPVDVKVAAEGDTATFTVEAGGEGLQYSWYHKNPGQTQFYKSGVYEASISLPVTAARNGRQQYCVITDKYGNTVTSNTVTMSISEELRIITQPENVVVASIGETATFTVKAEGEGLQYSWYHKNPGHTKFYKSSVYEPSISISMTAERNGRQQYCVVTDADGNSLTTEIVSMTIQE